MASDRRSAANGAPPSAVLLVLAASAALVAASPVASSEKDSGTVDVPKSHFKVERPADLFPDTAETVYQNIRAEMAAGYALAKMPELSGYLSWRRFNKAPYRSATHGARYVNNYGNRAGEGYGAFEQVGRLPEGSILAKDSFTATVDGGIYPGPMFVMAKMRAGFNPQGGDWRYSMIMPDGSLFGETNGVNSDGVAFCNGCHAMRAGTDYLFFLPEEFRRRPLDVSP